MGEVTFTKMPLITWCKTQALRMSSNSAVSTTPSGLSSHPGISSSSLPALFWVRESSVNKRSRAHLITVDSPPVGDSSAQAGKRPRWALQ